VSPDTSDAALSSAPSDTTARPPNATAKPGSAQPGTIDGFPVDVLADRDYPAAGDFTKIELDGSGYRWIRLARTVGA